MENTPVGLNVDNYPPFNGWNGVATLVGAIFRGGTPSGPAITNTGTLYARNVTSSGFKQVLVSRSSKGNVTGSDIVEYVSEEPVRLFANSARTSLRLPIKPEPTLPWENRLGNWVCANNYGAVYGSGADNTAAFQRAIDAATARGATTVYLRGSDGGTYQMNGKVKVRGSVQRFMALGWGRIVAGSTNAKFIVDDTSAPIVKFHNLQAFGGRPVTVENRSSTNAMVVESSDVSPLGTGRGDIFVTDCSCRVKLFSPGQNLWARQLNPEGDDNVGLVQNYGANLWVLGVKHEGGGIRFRTSDGGKTEILGLFNYSTGVRDNDSRPMFDVDNSAIAAAGVREITFGNAYQVKLREVRQGSIQQTQQGGWTGWALYSGWNPRLTNGPTAAALPVVEPADNQFNTNAGVFVNTGRHTWSWPGGGSFVDSLDLTATTSTPNAQLRYTADGTEPSLASTPWPQVLTISNSVTIKVKAFAPPLAPSATAVIPLTALAPRPPNPSWGPANGLNDAYYEIPVGSTRLPAFANLTAKTNGVAPIPDATPRLREKGFALRFTGAVTIPTRGLYGFFLSSSDGSRLLLGNDRLIDNNGAHGNQEKSRYLAMEAGEYPISVEFFNGGGTHDLTLSYEGPNLPKQPIPASAFVVRNSIPIPPPTTPGLEYQYFQGSWSALPDFDSLQPVKIGVTGAVSIAPRLRNNDYGLRLFGWIYLPKDGVWRFSTTSDDGLALFLGSTQIVKNDGTHGMVEQSGTVAAVAGLHPFIVTFFQGNGGQGLIASYEGPDTPKRVIPTTAYFRSHPGIVQTGLSRDQFWLDYLRPVYGPASAYQYLVDASEDLPNWSGGLPQINQSNVLSDPPYRLVRAYHPESTTLFTHGFLRLTVKSP